MKFYYTDNTKLTKELLFFLTKFKYFIVVGLLLILILYLFFFKIKRVEGMKIIIDSTKHIDLPKDTIKVDTRYSAVIVEPREHKALEFVLTNFLENLNNDWTIIIIHGNNNEDYLNNIIDTKLNNYTSRIKKINIKVDNLTVAEYSELFYDEEFYNCIPTEMFLIFQTDSIILKENRENIYQFMNYDYVGAPWPDNMGILGVMGVGNGGLSLRRKSKMVSLLKYKNIAITKNTDYKYGKYIAEDQFFNGYYIDQVAVKKPSKEFAKQFSVECIFYEKPFGIHKIWGFPHCMNKNNFEYLYNTYPDITKLNFLN
jgi:hypothetical protein